MGNESPMIRTVRIGFILAIAIGAIALTMIQQRNKPTTTATVGDPSQRIRTIHGKVGSEKREFLEDPQVAALLKDRYHIVIEADKSGSIEMVQQSTTGLDFIWPSSQVAAQMYTGKKRSEDVIFRSPLVLYSWSAVTDAMIQRGLVQKINGTYYVVEMAKLVTAVNSGTSWSQWKLNDLNGTVTIRSTDPKTSNSGMLFAGLLATVGNNGEVITSGSLPKRLPAVVTFFRKLGFMEESSADLFRQYIETGMGQDPIIVGYESQLIEFSVASPDQAKTISQDIRVLYPRPTVWCDHPLIALNDTGDYLLRALRDDADLRRIAWEKHGFRTGAAGTLSTMTSLGIPGNVPSVVAAPQPEVMTQILNALKK